MNRIEEYMDKRKSILNVSVSIIFKIITMIMVIVVKRILIRTCGNEVNGLNALYLSIIGILSVAELGVGSAITFCMYKPIVEGNDNQVSALYGLFQRLYLIIGCIIFVCGLCVTPFLHLFARDYAAIDINLYVTFVLMLISVVISYIFSSKTSLINAYKDNYVTTAITSGGILLQYFLQILALILLHSFEAFLICRIISVIIQWTATEYIVRRKYSNIITQRCNINGETKKRLMRSIKAMFMHKVGALLVDTADSTIISIFVGVIALGEYSNYKVIMTSLLGIIKLVFTSLTSVIGHLFVQRGETVSRKYCDAFHILNFGLGMFFLLGYYAIVDNLVAVLFAPDLVCAREISFVITLDGFVQYMRLTILTFRDATGTFYEDRWKPLLEGGVNIVLSVLLVKQIGVTGVIVATIITSLLICHIVEPYVLYKNAFKCLPFKYIGRNYLYIGVFLLGMFGLDFCMQNISNGFVDLLADGFISVGISIVCCIAVLLLSKREDKRLIIALIKKRGNQE